MREGIKENLEGLALLLKNGFNLENIDQSTIDQLVYFAELMYVMNQDNQQSMPMEELNKIIMERGLVKIVGDSKRSQVYATEEIKEIYKNEVQMIN